MVGNEWKNLPASVKQSWEDRASKLNEESAAARRELDESMCSSPGPNEHQPGYTFECLWDKCDYQFEDAVDCMEHCIQDGNGHIQRTYAAQGSEAEYVCHWRNCIRMKKNMQAFPSLLRLIKHVREVHLSKGGKVIAPSDRSKNYTTRKHKISQSMQGNNQTMAVSTNQLSPRGAANFQDSHQAQYQNQMMAMPVEPIFVTVPPRPQRVLHSEAYIKYIEGLQNNSPHVVSWQKTLKPLTPANVGSKVNMPSHWLGNIAKTNPEHAVKALCHLRNFMVNDVLQLQQF